MTKEAASQLEERLKKRVVRLDLAGNHGKAYGTAFFISDRIALTAFHNIEKNLAIDPEEAIKGECGDGEFSFTWLLPQDSDRAWQHDADIAILLADWPLEDFESLDCGYLPEETPFGEREFHWAGVEVGMAGFPAQNGNEFYFTRGDVDRHYPLKSSPKYGDDKRVIESPLNLAMREKLRYSSWPGVSGAPIYSVDDAAIVGIMVAASEATQWATDLAPLAKHWSAERTRFTRLKLRRPPQTPPSRDYFWRRIAIIAGLAILVLAGLLWRQHYHPIPKQLVTEVMRLDSGVIEPVNDGATFKVGEKVRFRFTPPASGNLYVVDRELDSSGNSRNPLIIFPTLRTAAGRNRVTAGIPVSFPAEDDVPPYVRPEPTGDSANYEGELMTILIFPAPLPVRLDIVPVAPDPSLFSPDGFRSRSFLQPLAPPADAVAIRQIRLRVTR